MRTQKDEIKLDEQLRREEAVKTEVIVELRQQNRELLQSNRRLLENLLQSSALIVNLSKALDLYREQTISSINLAIQNSSSCVPYCTRHEWDTEDGWKMK